MVDDVDLSLKPYESNGFYPSPSLPTRWQDREIQDLRESASRSSHFENPIRLTKSNFKLFDNNLQMNFGLNDNLTAGFNKNWLRIFIPISDKKILKKVIKIQKKIDEPLLKAGEKVVEFVKEHPVKSAVIAVAAVAVIVTAGAAASAIAEGAITAETITTAVGGAASAGAAVGAQSSSNSHRRNKDDDKKSLPPQAASPSTPPTFNSPPPITPSNFTSNPSLISTEPKSFRAEGLAQPINKPFPSPSVFGNTPTFHHSEMTQQNKIPEVNASAPTISKPSHLPTEPFHPVSPTFLTQNHISQNHQHSGMTHSHPSPIQSSQLEGIAHPIRRTAESERIGSVATSSIKTAVQHTQPKEPPTLGERTLDTLKDIGRTGVSLVSGITHGVWNVVGSIGAERERGQDLLAKALNTPIDHEPQQPDKTAEGHAKIDEFFGTHQAHLYDPNYKPPLKITAGEIPLPTGVLALAGRASQISSLETNVARTGSIASEAIKDISLVEKTGLATREASVAKNIETKSLPLAPATLAEGEVSGAASNRVVFEEYKTVLRQQMEKPFVTNPELKAEVDKLYRPTADIGSGSTAAAIRYERVTGNKVRDTLHSQKGGEAITFLEKWLKNNPTASSTDRAAAENIIKDLKNALE